MDVVERKMTGLQNIGKVFPPVKLPTVVSIEDHRQTAGFCDIDCAAQLYWEEKLKRTMEISCVCDWVVVFLFGCMVSASVGWTLASQRLFQRALVAHLHHNADHITTNREQSYAAARHAQQHLVTASIR